MRKLIYTLLALATLTSVKAQTTDTLNITLQQALDIALSENPTIKVADVEIQRQQYVKDETRGYLLPTLSGTGTYTYNIQNQVWYMPEDIFGPGTGGAMSMGYANSLTGAFNLSLPLYAPTLYETLKLNDAQMRQAVEQARSSKIDLATMVKKSFYNVLLAERSLELIEENITLAQEIVTNNENAFAQGVCSEYDLTTARVQLSNLSPTLYSSESALYNAKLMFNMLLGLPLETPVRIDGALIHFVDYIKSNTNHTLDIENNSSLKLLDIQKEMLEAQLKIQKAVKLPSLAAFGQYQVQTQADHLNIGSYEWAGSSYVGVQLSIPIFAGLTNKNKERQITNQQSQLDIQRDYMVESLSVEAQTAVSNIQSSAKQMEANLTAKELATKGYTIAKIRYDTGMGTILEVNSAQLQLLQADMNYLQSIFNYMSSQADYDKAVGSDF